MDEHVIAPVRHRWRKAKGGQRWHLVANEALRLAFDAKARCGWEPKRGWRDNDGRAALSNLPTNSACPKCLAIVQGGGS
jgi:hypothetical protein